MKYILKTISFILVLGLFLSFSVYKGSDPNKDRLLLELISYVLERGHYNPKKIDDNFSKNVFSSYIKGLDNQRRFFLQSDIANFSKYKNRIDDLIKNSDISFFDLTIEKLFQRIGQVNLFYQELLEKPFDFSKEEFINLDFDNLSYVRTLNDLKIRWRMRFKLSALQIYMIRNKKKMIKRKRTVLTK